MRIAIASDHAALALKSALVEYLLSAGHDVNDLGPHDENSVD
jgi:ribose 5-phosphate isomerase B